MFLPKMRIVKITVLLMASFAAGIVVSNILSGGEEFYFIAYMDIKDRDLYSKYAEKVPDIVKKYGGEYIIRTEDVIPMAGGLDPDRVVVIRFRSLDAIKKCFNSSEYLNIMPIREKSVSGKAVIVKGCRF